MDNENLTSIQYADVNHLVHLCKSPTLKLAELIHKSLNSTYFGSLVMQNDYLITMVKN